MAEKFIFQPAAREAISAKITLAGVSGAGKSTAALTLAYGLCGDWSRIAVADTENRRALYAVGQRYGDLEIGQFMHCPVSPPFSPQRLADLVRQVEGDQFDVLVIDSMTKEWEGQGGTLEQVENSGSGQNKFTAWKAPGDAHRKFIDAVQFSSLHVICTLRSKMKYDLVDEVNAQGKTVSKPVKRGLEAIARAGTEYEFDVSWAIDREEHHAWVDKDNTNLFGADAPGPITVEHGKRIVEWIKGATSQIGSAEWVGRRVRQLAEYSGSIDGLATLWTQVSPHRPRIAAADFAKLVAAKDASKGRLTAAAV